MVAPRGACMVALGGHVWLLWGGMRGCSRAGGVRGCSQGNMRGCSEGCGCSGGACMVAPGGMRGSFWGGMRGIRQDTEIRSMSGRYASYWNAFLLKGIFIVKIQTRGRVLKAYSSTLS